MSKKAADNLKIVKDEMVSFEANFQGYRYHRCPPRNHNPLDFHTPDALHVLELPEEKVCTWVSSFHVVMIAILYDIRNPNQVAVWRKEFEVGGLPTLENKCRRCTQAIRNISLSNHHLDSIRSERIDTLQALRDENEQLCTEVAYLKKCTP